MDRVLVHGIPVVDSLWREIDCPGHAGKVTAASALYVTIDAVELPRLSFLYRFEPVQAEADALDNAILRASVRAFRELAPTDDYPTTWEMVWRGATIEERQHQVIASRGFFCGDHPPDDDGDVDDRRGEILRWARHHRCAVCGEPTLWFHFADARRTRAALAAYRLKEEVIS